MTKEIVLCGWISMIPSKMFNGWVKKKWFPKDAVYITSTEKKKPWSAQIMEKDVQVPYANDPKQFYCQPERKMAESKSDIKRLQAQGYRKTKIQYYLPEKAYNTVKREIGKWYDKVFTYVEEWLQKEGFIHLENGTFGGGFCAIPYEDETTKNWGAPLAKKENKVIQIKEKFGDIVVYFTGLTDEENKKVKLFANQVEKKFDCSTRFC